MQHGIDRMQERLREAISQNHFPPAYFDNAIVKENPPGTVMPIAVYVDVVPFSRTDAAIGFFIYNMLSGIRTLSALLRKTELCQCGCKAGAVSMRCLTCCTGLSEHCAWVNGRPIAMISCLSMLTGRAQENMHLQSSGQEGRVRGHTRSTSPL